MADNYKDLDMQRLQQDAIRRAREMQARAQSTVSSHNSSAQRSAPVQSRPSAPPSAVPPARQIPPQGHSVPPRAPAPEPDRAPEPKPGLGLLNPVGDIFESLMADSERTMILVLLLLLVEDKADTGVIFALMYLIL